MYKNEYIYPAIVIKHSDNDYEVKFYDFEHIVTYGETLEQAYFMAEDALKLELFDLYCDNEEIPSPTCISMINIEKNSTPMLCKVNLKEVIKEFDNKAVKKTLTVPSWLNKEAEKANINFSQLLQEALRNRLDL